MIWQEAVLRSKTNIAVRINKIGKEVFRDNGQAYSYSPDFVKEFTQVEGYDDWKPL